VRARALGTAMLMRDARREDAPSVAALLVACWNAAYREFVPTHYLDALDPVTWADGIEDGIRTGPQRTYVCEDRGDVTGFVTIGPCRDDDCEPAVDGEIRVSTYARRTLAPGLRKDALRPGLQGSSLARIPAGPRLGVRGQRGQGALLLHGRVRA